MIEQEVGNRKKKGILREKQDGRHGAAAPQPGASCFSSLALLLCELQSHTPPKWRHWPSTCRNAVRRSAADNLFGSPDNREPFAARSSQSESRPVPPSPRSQLNEWVCPHQRRRHAISPLCTYLFCGPDEALVYATRVDDVNTLRDRTVAGCETIGNIPEIHQRIRESMQWRVDACVRADLTSAQHWQATSWPTVSRKFSLHVPPPPKLDTSMPCAQRRQKHHLRTGTAVPRRRVSLPDGCTYASPTRLTCLLSAEGCRVKCGPRATHYYVALVLVEQQCPANGSTKLQNCRKQLGNKIVEGTSLVPLAEGNIPGCTRALAANSGNDNVTSQPRRTFHEAKHTRKNVDLSELPYTFRNLPKKAKRLSSRLRGHRDARPPISVVGTWSWEALVSENMAPSPFPYIWLSIHPLRHVACSSRSLGRSSLSCNPVLTVRVCLQRANMTSAWSTRVITATPHFESKLSRRLNLARQRRGTHISTHMCCYNLHPIVKARTLRRFDSVIALVGMHDGSRRKYVGSPTSPASIKAPAYLERFTPRSASARAIKATPPQASTDSSVEFSKLESRWCIGVTPGLSHVGIVPDDAASRRVFSGISRSSRPCIPAPLHIHSASPSSALKTESIINTFSIHRCRRRVMNCCAHSRCTQQEPVTTDHSQSSQQGGTRDPLYTSCGGSDFSRKHFERRYSSKHYRVAHDWLKHVRSVLTVCARITKVQCRSYGILIGGSNATPAANRGMATAEVPVRLKESHTPEASKRGSSRGDRDVRINSLITSTSEALNWRAVLPSIMRLCETFSADPNILRRNILSSTFKSATERVGAVVTHWTRIRDDPDSRSGYPDFGFPWFPEITPGECWDEFQTKAMGDYFPILPSSLRNLHQLNFPTPNLSRINLNRVFHTSRCGDVIALLLPPAARVLLPTGGASFFREAFTPSLDCHLSIQSYRRRVDEEEKISEGNNGVLRILNTQQFFRHSETWRGWVFTRHPFDVFCHAIVTLQQLKLDSTTTRRKPVSRLYVTLKTNQKRVTYIHFCKNIGSVGACVKNSPSSYWSIPHRTLPCTLERSLLAGHQPMESQAGTGPRGEYGATESGRGGGKDESTLGEQTRPTATSATFPTYDNRRFTPPEIEPGSSRRARYSTVDFKSAHFIVDSLLEQHAPAKQWWGPRQHFGTPFANQLLITYAGFTTLRRAHPDSPTRLLSPTISATKISSIFTTPRQFPSDNLHLPFSHSIRSECVTRRLRGRGVPARAEPPRPRLPACLHFGRSVEASQDTGLLPRVGVPRKADGVQRRGRPGRSPRSGAGAIARSRGGGADPRVTTRRACLLRLRHRVDKWPSYKTSLRSLIGWREALGTDREHAAEGSLLSGAAALARRLCYHVLTDARLANTCGWSSRCDRLFHLCILNYSAASLRIKAVHDKENIEVQHMYTEVSFATGSHFIRHGLDYSERIAGLQGNKYPIPYCQPTRVKRGEHGAASEGGTGDPREKPADQRHRPRTIPPRENPGGATRPGIENLVRLRWEASRLTARPPRSPYCGAGRKASSSRDAEAGPVLVRDPPTP
ncbi:hypothetical protein PR048_022046 [Dryococelus australis]|uniref:Uncharacterized protein n=1 Tax=Dryococelus australis TaxID=614101 RepID=A0ABQ9GZW8_9NEOP|nr:hypothetical protein PR048_022046 [Dryococelus australis]